MARPAKTFSRAGLAELKEASERLCQVATDEYERVEAAFAEAESEEARVASLHQLEWDKLGAERAELEAEKAAMEGVQKFLSSRVVLNVGGKRIETSRQTLCNAPESMLAAMFSGRHALTPDEDGSFATKSQLRSLLQCAKVPSSSHTLQHPWSSSPQHIVTYQIASVLHR